MASCFFFQYSPISGISRKLNSRHGHHEKWKANKIHFEKSSQLSFRTKVASTCMIMAKREDIFLVTLGNTSPYNLIWAVFEQIGIIPKKMFYLCQEF
jgi:hypothetical protein